MGADKAALIFDGEPLWARQLRVLRNLEPVAVQICARGRPSWCPPGVEIIPDQQPSRGPLSGVAAALRSARTSHVVLLAVDMPQMTAAHLRKLCGQAKPGCGVLPRRNDRFEPLCAVYPVEACSAAEEALEGEDVSMRGLARLLIERGMAAIYEVPSADEPLYRNINTPAD